MTRIRDMRKSLAAVPAICVCLVFCVSFAGAASSPDNDGAIRYYLKDTPIHTDKCEANGASEGSNGEKPANESVKHRLEVICVKFKCEDDPSCKALRTTGKFNMYLFVESMVDKDKGTFHSKSDTPINDLTRSNKCQISENSKRCRYRITLFSKDVSIPNAVDFVIYPDLPAGSMIDSLKLRAYVEATNK